jgi:hypothetical protein
MHKNTLRKQIKDLRQQCIDDDEADPILKRVAYAMEMAARRVSYKTVGWPSLAEEARREAALLREELAVRKEQP